MPLTNALVEPVLLRHIFHKPTPAIADQISNELGLPSGSVQFGAKAINIRDSSGEILHFQVTPQSKIVQVDIKDL